MTRRIARALFAILKYVLLGLLIAFWTAAALVAMSFAFAAGCFR